MVNQRIRGWLEGVGPGVFMAWGGVAAFFTYFCMYAFRKPFAVGTFEGEVEFPFIGGVHYKIVLIISQVLGYCLSKFVGIKVVSELPAGKRAVAILMLIGLAELALLGFAVVPTPYDAGFLFLNGLPLGMIWGLVFGFLEGRRTSDVLGAILASSFIVASGFVKTAGKLVMGQGVSEQWMPVTTGLAFVVPLVFFVWMLAQLPEPSKEDIASRTERAPMDHQARLAFFRTYAPGLVPLTVLYVFLTAYRDFRDNFARELWDALGYADAPEILTMAEIPVALGALVGVAVMVLFKTNRVALVAVHALMAGGTALVGGSTLLFQLGVLGPAPWMISVGLGLYLAYVPFNCVLFDRLVAAVGVVGTAGFLIYVTDAFGYLGSVALLLFKNFGQPDLSWLEFFIGFSYVTACLCTALYGTSAYYFWRMAPTAER